MKKALVTGSYGLVGSSAMRILNERGFNVIGIDNNMRAEFFGTDAIQGNDLDIDITDRLELEFELFSENEFDLIIHAAAQPSHDWAADHPWTDFRVNALGTLNLLELTREYCPNAVFIHVSTNKVYGTNPNNVKGVIDETLSIDNTMHSLFGCSKLAADIYAQEYARYFGLKTGIFRCGCITGKAHKAAEQHGFLAYIAKCVKEKKPYTIYGDGWNVRDNIHADDLVNAFLCFYEYPKPGEVYNIGGGALRQITVRGAIKRFQEIIGNEIELRFGDARKGDHFKYITDCSKFIDDYPEWDYQYSLDDIFNELAE